MQEIGSFRSSRAKLEWARRQHDILAREIAEIVENHDDTPGLQMDPISGAIIVEGERRRDIDDIIVVHIGRIIGVLRSALDNLVVEATLMASPEADSRNVVFPISGNEEKPGCSKWMGEKVSGLAEKHRRIIVDLRPYKGGHPILLPLHQLRNQDEHLSIVVAAVVSANVFTSKVVQAPAVRKGPDGKDTFFMKTTHYPAKHEVRTTVQFGEGTVAHRREVLQTIADFLATTADIIARFEAA